MTLAFPIARPVVFPLFGVTPDGKCACGVPECARIGKHSVVNWGDVAYGAAVPRPEPGAGAGIRTGAHPQGSDVFVVDLDGPQAAEIFDALGECPDTFTVATPRTEGGWHLYFKHPGFPVKTSQGELGRALAGKATHIDVRGEGGIVVAPGSPHKNGGRYEVCDDSPIADAPGWLLDWLRTQKAATEARVYAGDVKDPVERERRRGLYAEYLRHEATPRGEAHRGQGDKILFDVVQRGAYDLELPVDDVLECIREHYDPRCSPPWGRELEERVHHKADDAKGASTRPRAVPLPADLVAAPSAAPPPPAPAAGRPPFPIDALPEAIRAFVVAEAEATQTPVDMAAMLALGCCSAAIAGKVEISLGVWEEPLNLFVCVVAPPGKRKSGVLSSVMRPLHDAEEARIVAAAPLISTAKTARDLLVEQIKRTKSDLAKLKPHEHDVEWKANQIGCTPQGGVALRKQIADMEARLRLLDVPAEPRLIADDASMESLAQLMSRNGGRLCVAAAEGTIFGIAGGRYSGAPSFDVLLKGHAGDPLIVDRKSKDHEPIRIRRACLTLALAVQPSIIERLNATSEMKGQGLPARFLFCLPGERPGPWDPNPPRVPDAIRAAYERAVRALDAVQTPQETAVLGRQVDINDVDSLLSASKAAAGTLPTIGLGPEAAAVFQAFRIEHHERMAGDLAKMLDWAEKWPGAVARIAGILHVLDRGPSGEVSGGTMANAIAIGRYLLEHARAAFGLTPSLEVEDDAQAIADWIRDGGRKEFTRRDIARGPKAGRDKKRREAALELLFDQGIIIPAGAGFRVA